MRPADEQFLSLLVPEQGRMMRIAMALTGQEADAWDLLQDASLAAYDRFGSLRGGPEAFGPWIRRILINKARTMLQRRNRTVHLEAVGETDPDPSPGPEERLEQAQLWEQVTALEEHHRHVLVLRFLVDMPIEEIAEVLGVPGGTVKSRVHRALGALRRRLEHEAKGAAIR